MTPSLSLLLKGFPKNPQRTGEVLTPGTPVPTWMCAAIRSSFESSGVCVPPPAVCVPPAMPGPPISMLLTVMVMLIPSDPPVVIRTNVAVPNDVGLGSTPPKGGGVQGKTAGGQVNVG